MNQKFSYIQDKYTDADVLKVYEKICFDIVKSMYPHLEVHPTTNVRGVEFID